MTNSAGPLPTHDVSALLDPETERQYLAGVARSPLPPVVALSTSNFPTCEPTLVRALNLLDAQDALCCVSSSSSSSLQFSVPALREALRGAGAVDAERVATNYEQSLCCAFASREDARRLLDLAQRRDMYARAEDLRTRALGGGALDA